MLELAAADPAASVAWYARHFGMAVTLADPATGFTLVEGPGGRLAFKPGAPSPAGIILHFEVADITPFPGTVKISVEGYARKRFADPDGYSVVAFARKAPNP